MSFEQDSVPARAGNPIVPVLVIGAASAALAYFMSFYSSQPRTVSITPSVATPAAVERVEPAPFATPPQAAVPAQTAAPAATPAAQDTPVPPRRPPVFKKKQQKKDHRSAH
ncbi:hypothetical protein FJY94_00590 [Candidatus Kaiserbacteria bacterium]|nr:hypothetical protein [Candidatus Kaiserbacteria bacterium]